MWMRNALAQANSEHNDGLPRIVLKMATGAGKTVVMPMLIAWLGELLPAADLVPADLHGGLGRRRSSSPTTTFFWSARTDRPAVRVAAVSSSTIRAKDCDRRPTCRATRTSRQCNFIISAETDLAS